MMAGKNQVALAVCAQTKVIFPFNKLKENKGNEEPTRQRNTFGPPYGATVAEGVFC